MRKSFIISIFFLNCILLNTDVFAAPKRTALSNKKRSATTSKTTVSGTYNTATSTYTPANMTVNIATAKSEDSSAMSCGTPASSSNMVAKRLCATAYSDALGTYCNNTKCTSTIKVAMNLNFGLSILNDVSIDVNGTTCNGDNLDKFCSNFAEELVSGLWPLYSDQAKRERKTCNFAKAKFNAAQDCFNYVLSQKNTAGLTGFFSTSKQNDIDKEIEKICGKDAIIENYKKISIDDWDENDNDLFFNEATNTVSNKTAIGANKKLSSSVATQFANVGNANWNISGKVGRFLDLDWDLKTSTYPRELTVLVNSFITDGETSCGSQFRTEMQDTSFAIKNKQSNLEREIAKKGLLKGLFDYSLNQASAIMGDEWADTVKGDGIVGTVKKAAEKRKNKPIYTPQNKKIKELSTSCNQYNEKEFKELINGYLITIKDTLDKIDTGKSFTVNYPLIKTDLTEIVKQAITDIDMSNYQYTNITDKSSDEEVKEAITDIKQNVVEKLLKSEQKYNCDKGFRVDIDNKEYKFSIDYSKEKEENWDENTISTIKALFENTAVLEELKSIIENKTEEELKEEIENWESIKPIIDIIKTFQSQTEE